MRSFVKPPNPANDNLTDPVIENWRQFSDRVHNCEEAKQITNNIVGFFKILVDWSQAELPEPVNDREKIEIPSRIDEVRHDR